MRIWMAMVMAAMALTACNNEPKALTITDAVVRLSANPKSPSAAYFTVKGGATADRLLFVTSPVVVKSELHESMSEGAMASMKPLDGGVEIPAGGDVAFKPGGKHAMLYDVDPQIQEGRTVLLNFTFASGLRLEAYAKVRGAGAIL